MAIKNRNPIFVIALSIITLGIYAIYWFYCTRKDLYEINKKNGNAIIDLVLCCIPFVGFYVLYKYSEDVELATKGAQNKWIIFLLWLVFFPAAQYVVQTEINKFAGA